MPVSELMGELLDMQDFLTMEDLEYVRSQGFFPTVKKWAAQAQQELATSKGLLPEEDELSGTATNA